MVLLVCASAANWDVSIARYNLSKKESVPLDVPFLLSLSDKTLPLIEKNKDVLQKDTAVLYQYYYNNAAHNAADFFEFRKSTFLNQQRDYSWLSWNVADASVTKELTGNTNYSSLK